MNGIPIVFCGCCDHALSYVANKRPYFHCRRSQAYETGPCHDLKIDAEELEQVIWGTIKAQLEAVLSIRTDGSICLDTVVAERTEYEKQIQWLFRSCRGTYTKAAPQAGAFQRCRTLSAPHWWQTAPGPAARQPGQPHPPKRESGRFWHTGRRCHRPGAFRPRCTTRTPLWCQIAGRNRRDRSFPENPPDGPLAAVWRIQWQSASGDSPCCRHSGETGQYTPGAWKKRRVRFLHSPLRRYRLFAGLPWGRKRIVHPR